MPERKICSLPGQLHFITFSTYQRRRFLSPERTRAIVCEILQIRLDSEKARCHGFVIMPNHVHAILTIQPGSTISSFLQVWKKTSSYRIKQFYLQELANYSELCPENDPVWQAGFYDFEIRSDEKVREKIEYMHKNPVTAGLISTPFDWRWSSARFYEQGQDVGVRITPVF